MAQYCDNFKFSENNQDHFVMGPVSNDTFQFWQGLRGPYFTPSVGDDGYLYWTNNGQLPNPEPVKIVGKDGRGITLTGQCATVAELPEDPEQGEAWAVGAEEPFECYAWFGEWVDMGLLFPAGQDGVSPAVTITTTATGHKVKITDRDHLSGQEFNVDDGEDGDPGQDGISPTVTITTTATGHKVKITDRDHPSGQEFNVDDGEDGDPGPGVPAGGSAGQFYRKASGTDYDGEWHTLSAGDSSYDSSLTYSSGTVGKELSDQKNTLNSEIATLQTYVRPNLLDNWYFVYGKTINNDYSNAGTFPVNQRGQRTYSPSSAGYTIDRWYANGSVTVNTDYLAVGASVIQRVENIEQLVGKTLTFSIMTMDGGVFSGSQVLASVSDSTIFLWDTFRLIYSSYWGGFQIYKNDSSSFDLKAVKLEVGSGQTLAHWDGTKWVLNEIPNYGEELAKCQRYFYKFSGYFFVPKGEDAVHSNATFVFPVQMANTPSISGITGIDDANWSTPILALGSNNAQATTFRAATDSSRPPLLTGFEASADL